MNKSITVSVTKIIKFGIIIISLIIVFVFLGLRLTTNKEELNSQLTSAIQEQNEESFLDLFDDEVIDSEWAYVGAKTILEDWNQNSQLPLDQIMNSLDGYNSDQYQIAGVKSTYNISVKEKKKFIFFTDYELYTLPSILKLDDSIDDVTLYVNDKKVKKNDFKDAFFPGQYTFEIKDNESDSESNTIGVFLAGDGKTINLDLTGIVSSSNSSLTYDEDGNAATIELSPQQEQEISDRIRNKYEAAFGTDSSTDNSNSVNYDEDGNAATTELSPQQEQEIEDRLKNKYSSAFGSDSTNQNTEWSAMTYEAQAFAIGKARAFGEPTPGNYGRTDYEENEEIISKVIDKYGYAENTDYYFSELSYDGIRWNIEARKVSESGLRYEIIKTYEYNNKTEEIIENL